MGMMVVSELSPTHTVLCEDTYCCDQLGHMHTVSQVAQPHTDEVMLRTCTTYC